MSDPTYGYDLRALLQVGAPDGPQDLADFWQQTYRDALATRLGITRREVPCPREGLRLFEIEFNTPDGVRIGGWLTVPADGHFERGLVMSHGYGGRQEPDLSPPGPPAVAIMPCARGFDRSAHPDIPGEAMRHVLVGITSRDTYSHRGCVTDLWCAASALIELYPEAADTLHYSGGSFGGGIGAMVLAWDKRFCRGALRVPSFGNHPLRLTLPCTGSGEAVRRYAREHPEVIDVLAYFDAAVHARHITCPVLFECALADPAVPPPGQFAVFNATAAPTKLIVREAGHSDHPANTLDDQRADLLRSLWFSAADPS